MSSQVVHDKYLGRKDIVLFASSVISSLFPTPAAPTKASVLPVAQWLAYTLYRTMLPDEAVLHALELLRRLSGDFQCTSPIEPSEFEGDWDPVTSPALLHHRLFTSCLVLVTTYWMDDAYSNKSWAVATKGYFSTRDVDDMELSMLAALDFCILDRQRGQSAESLLARWGADFAAWKEERLLQEKRERDPRASAPHSLREAFKSKVCGWQNGGHHSSSSGVWVST